VVDGADKLREGAIVEMVVRDNSPPKDGPRKGRRGAKADAGAKVEPGAKADASGAEQPSAEERLKRWKDLNERIDKGEFGEEIKKLPEEERKQRMREMRSKKQQ
jgi:multidrug efflux system membrane fusion protein